MTNIINKTSVFRKEHFNAAHRLHNPDWDDAKNAEFYGKCNNANYHGHNYDLIVKLTGFHDPVTGYLFDLKLLSDIIKADVLDVFDHKNLNLDVSYFKNLNPSAENIAVTIYNILRLKIEDSIEIKITLFETERNYVEYPA